MHSPRSCAEQITVTNTHEQIESSDWHFTRTADAQRLAVHVTRARLAISPHLIYSRQFVVRSGVASRVLPLQRLKIRKVIGPAFFGRHDVGYLPTEVRQRVTMRAVLHPGPECIAAIEVAVVSFGDFALHPYAQLQPLVG